MSTKNLDPRIKANAVCAYLFVFISWSFLINKTNYLLNNDFVKMHTKTAMLIHIGFLSALIFKISGLASNFYIFDYSINEIIFITLCLILLGFLLFGVYKANLGELFSMGETIELAKGEKNILDINSDSLVSEKDKLTIILSKIPFIGFIIAPKYQDSILIQNSSKLNSIISFIISLGYIFGNTSLATLILLAYIIFVVFLSINLVTRNETINIKLDNIPTLRDLRIHSEVLIRYLYSYIKDKDFKGYEYIYNKIKIEKQKLQEIEEKELQEKNDFRLTNIIIYIPIINLVSIFNLNSKLKNHIINGSIISILFIISWFSLGMWNYIQLILLFPLFYSIGYLGVNLSYKIPFLYDFYLILKSFSKLFSLLQKKHREEKILSLKVK